jgi:hypothetical protein
VLQKRPKGWTASVRDYLGAVLVEAGPLARVESAEITKNGSYATVRWLVPDQNATHTFLDVKNKIRKDIPSGDLYLGKAVITEDGKVLSGKKPVFDFTTEGNDVTPKDTGRKP